MAANKTTLDSPKEDITEFHDNQPILLCSSDTLPLTPPPSSAVSEIMYDTGDEDKEEPSLSSQDKRKWDQVVDDSSQTNIAKVALYDRSISQSESPSIVDDNECQDSDDLYFLISKKPGRKPLADEDPFDDGDPKVKRKAQNRAAQRAFRERKERYVKELEIKLKQMQDAHIMATNHMFQENHQLRSIACLLESENVALKGIHLQQGQLPEKPTQDWVTALQQQQQQLFTAIDPFVSTTTANSVYNRHSLQDLLRLPDLLTQIPLDTLAMEPTSSNQQQQQQQKYTFSVSTPDTLRSRHKKQYRSNVSPPLAPKPRSPVELVRLYSHEQSTMEPATASSSAAVTTGLANTRPSPLSPASPSSSTHISSGAQTPTLFDDNLQEVHSIPFDLLLSSKSLFDSTGGLDKSLDLPLFQQDNQVSASPSSCSSSLFDAINDYDALDCPTTTIASTQDIWNGLEHHSTDQLVKSTTNSTDVDPVLLEDYLE